MRAAALLLLLAATIVLVRPWGLCFRAKKGEKPHRLSWWWRILSNGAGSLFLDGTHYNGGAAVKNIESFVTQNSVVLGPLLVGLLEAYLMYAQRHSAACVFMR